MVSRNDNVVRHRFVLALQPLPHRAQRGRAGCGQLVLPDGRRGEGAREPGSPITSRNTIAHYLADHRGLPQGIEGPKAPSPPPHAGAAIRQFFKPPKSSRRAPGPAARQGGADRALRPRRQCATCLASHALRAPAFCTAPASQRAPNLRIKRGARVAITAWLEGLTASTQDSSARNLTAS